MHEALFYTKHENKITQCNLCPWNCVINDGQTGNCKVRSNENGKLYTQVYNKIATSAVDPIEKKPLYHFYPGKNILSIGEVGCNLHCNFCQNHRISQCLAKEFTGFQSTTSEEIVFQAVKPPNNIGIAYTYNEPFTFYEFMLDTAKLAHKSGLKNVVVSNGYINPEPLKKLLPFIDAFNIDLKGFSNEFYSKQTKGKLDPVLNTLKIIAKSNAHLEITNLVIPELNDDPLEFEKMTNWISTELGNQTPLHLSRYFPQYKLQIPATSVEKLEILFNLAKKHLQYVYLGNVSDKKRSSTICPNCNAVLVERNQYKTVLKQVDLNGNCQNCGTSCLII